MMEKYLQDIGLTEKEVSVYVALLQVDNNSVLELSKKTRVNRTTVYLVLEGLMKKGLVSEIQQGKKTYYQAEPPERLETYVERKKIELEEHSKRLRDVIPQLKSIRRESGERPVVKFYEGSEGILSAYEEFISETEEEKDETVYYIYSRDLIEETFSEQERQKYKQKRIGKGIKSKTVYTYKKGELPSDSMGSRVKLDENKYPLFCDIATFGDKVVISILQKKVYSIFTRSQDLADTVRSLVNYIHDNEKKEGGSHENKYSE